MREHPKLQRAGPVSCLVLQTGEEWLHLHQLIIHILAAVVNRKPFYAYFFSLYRFGFFGGGRTFARGDKETEGEDEKLDVR